MSITIKYFYSACVEISTPDVKILCDPWFTDGAYDGSWYLWPPPQIKPTEADLIYISHIHPDHYDPRFLKAAFPSRPVTIQDREPNYLARKLAADGIPFQKVKTAQIGQTTIKILPDIATLYEIDSVLIVTHGNESVINANDANLNNFFLPHIKRECPDPTVLLLGHAGASAHPQCYYDVHDPKLLSSAKEKYERRLWRYLWLCEEIGARINIPFAGQYLLGGKLHSLNAYRGIGDDVDVMGYDKNSRVPAEGATMNCATLSGDLFRFLPYNKQAMDAYSLSLAHRMYDYESDPVPHEVDWKGLATQSLEHALKRAPAIFNAYLCIRLLEDHAWAWCHGEKKTIGHGENVSHLLPRWEAHVNPRLLYGLFTRKYNWNNAYVGSLFPIRIYPYEFDDTPVTAFLPRCHV